MSGGHFDYAQDRIMDIIESVEKEISNNGKTFNEHGYDYMVNYSDSVIEEFKNGLEILRKAQIYAQRIDWLVSGDDNEESFLERLKKDLDKGDTD